MNEINSWGVLDENGQWIVWGVPEWEARHVYNHEFDAVLCCDFDLDINSYREVARKGLILNNLP